LRALFCRSRIERRFFLAKSSLAAYRHAADGIRFLMLPYQLVGVAAGRIGRQKEQAQFAAQRLPESAGFLRAMRRATINDQEDFALGTPDQAPRECDENSGVDVSVCQSSMIVGSGCTRTNARTWSSCAASVCHLWPLNFRGRQSPVVPNCRMSLIAQLALPQSCAPPRGGTARPKPPEPCVRANPANTALPSMPASIPAGVVKQVSAGSGIRFRFCLIGTCLSYDSKGIFMFSCKPIAPFCAKEFKW
jgi:hypothetical protein